MSEIDAGGGDYGDGDHGDHGSYHITEMVMVLMLEAKPNRLFKVSRSSTVVSLSGM